MILRLLKKCSLPELIVNNHIVRNESLIEEEGQLLLFANKAKTMTEVRKEQRDTIDYRCEKALSLADGKTSVYWVNLNDEGDIIDRNDDLAVQIKGSMSIDKKEEILISFAKGEIKRLITKAKMTGMGLNWQHCNHSVFFPTWSYEQYYQAIRRFWRFGQKEKVNIDLVISDGQTRVTEALKQKTQKAKDLYENLVKNVNSDFNHQYKEFNKEINLPKFI